MGLNVEYGDGQTGFFTAATGTPKGGLVVIHEVWGLTDHIKDVAGRFAAEGYVTLAPDLLSGVGIDPAEAAELQADLFDPEKRNAAQPRLRQLMAPMQSPEFGRQTTERVQQAFDHLAGLSETGGRVGVVGYCFGGTYAFALAVAEPRLRAAVPYYGHADYGRDELGAIKCPVLAFYGEDDANLMASLPELTDSMHAAGVDFRAHTYPGAGHAFFNDTNRHAYAEEAANDAWRRTLDFLGTAI
ncbi:dienelactone hydrolase family protein [Spelaeicoccus albus]|uniref:Carboxymethylenebutenolidase n=1 Tax=Spelaeicoccus albus TaxID=1280376 RepID=A0A7Z0D196_9MICO|nr:dienelactone hydrolase family protein [Spelaeicoccus albus]NYI65877.1 carboxymethylenebutenolidase [Spelaeicoccus albus]